MVKSGVHPHEICRRIHACRRLEQEPFEIIEDLDDDDDVEEEIDESGSSKTDCRLCKFIYNQFKRVFSKKEKCEDVKRVMMIICKELRPETVRSCQDFVTNSMSEIFAVVVKTQNLKMCQNIGKCPAKKSFFDIQVTEV
jgi:hypothetical protein